MILLDANLLIYAHVASFFQHAHAKDWLDTQLNAGGRVGMPWTSLLGFLRIVTNPRIFERPESMREAWRQIEAWLEIDTVWIPEATERHRQVIGHLLNEAVTRSNLVPAAHIAALAIEHGQVLCSTDGDFARFPDLRWRNPLR